MRKYLKVHPALAIFCLLALCSVLTACSTIAGVGATATPTATFTQQSGPGYTIGSPPNWTSLEQSGSDPGSTILGLQDDLQDSGSTNDLLPNVHMTVITGNNNNNVPLLTQVQSYLNITGVKAGNFQQISVPSTVTINGVQWVQVAGTMDDVVPPATVTTYVIATLFPSDSTKQVLITYSAPTSEFNQVNTKDFQPMLLSFKFT